MTDIQKWADSAMYSSEGTEHVMRDEDGNIIPTVHLLWMTPDPLGAVAAMAKMYKGEVVRSMRDDITTQDRMDMFDQMMRTHLKAPLEAIKLHFMIEGVTRSFTHQMVRQRTAVYAQESLRFAVKDEPWSKAVSVPPSISALPKEDQARMWWDYGISQGERTYKHLIDLGIPAEDARGIMPHAMTTRLNYITDLRNLSEHAGNRLCTQAQFEWREVFTQIVRAIGEYQNNDRDCYTLPNGNCVGLNCMHDYDRWQFPYIANSPLFRPACYQQGHCPFQADFDRGCTIRGRVEAFARHGIPSAEWNESVLVPDVMDGDLELDPINPAEWLLDPTAARTGGGGHG